MIGLSPARALAAARRSFLRARGDHVAALLATGAGLGVAALALGFVLLAADPAAGGSLRLPAPAFVRLLTLCALYGAITLMSAGFALAPALAARNSIVGRRARGLPLVPTAAEIPTVTEMRDAAWAVAPGVAITAAALGLVAALPRLGPPYPPECEYACGWDRDLRPLWVWLHPYGYWLAGAGLAAASLLLARAPRSGPPTAPLGTPDACAPVADAAGSGRSQPCNRP